jgi:hypothetical protein
MKCPAGALKTQFLGRPNVFRYSLISFKSPNAHANRVPVKYSAMEETIVPSIYI